MESSAAASRLPKIAAKFSKAKMAGSCGAELAADWAERAMGRGSMNATATIARRGMSFLIFSLGDRDVTDEC